MSMMQSPSLASVALLSGLSPSELAEVASHVRVRSYRPDQTIVAAQDDTSDMFFILAGRVRVTLFSRTGREINYRDLVGGESFGELAAIDGGRRSANVIAQTPAVVGAMSAADFRQALHRYPSVLDATLRVLTARVRQLSERVAEFARPGPARVCAELLRVAEPHRAGRGARIVPAPSRKDMASRININREEVSRTIRLLEQGGLVRRAGRRELVIHDLARIADWADRIEGE
jgi:CRP-like cAMP-binding protein